MPLIEEKRDGSVLIVTLVDEATRNSLTMPMREELGNIARRIEADRAVRAVVLTARGKSFCAGGDMSLLRDHSDPWSMYRRFRGIPSWFVPWATLSKPVVVAVNGHAVGGGIGLALCGDILIAAEEAQFIPGFFRLGAVPDLGVLHFLPRLVGLAQARRFLFSEKGVTALEAQQMGLVANVVPLADLLDQAIIEARRFADGPSETIGLTKTLLLRSFETSLHEMIASEGPAQALAAAGPEFEEGIRSFSERRPPEFDKSCVEVEPKD